MEINLDHFDTIKRKLIRDLIQELKNLELPYEWKPREVLGFVIRKLEEKENKC